MGFNFAKEDFVENVNTATDMMNLHLKEKEEQKCSIINEIKSLIYDTDWNQEIRYCALFGNHQTDKIVYLLDKRDVPQDIQDDYFSCLTIALAAITYEVEESYESLHNLCFKYEIYPQTIGGLELFIVICWFEFDYNYDKIMKKEKK